MANPDFSFTCSEQPTMVEPDFRTLPPCTRMDNYQYDTDSHWKGSGFWIKDLPVYVWWYDDVMVCEHCKSMDVLTVCLEHFVCQTGKIIKGENVCRKCGWFTQFDGAD